MMRRYSNGRPPVSSMVVFHSGGTPLAFSGGMTVEPVRSRLSSPRVRTARDTLLNASATALLQPVREVICEPTRTQIVRALSAGPFSVGDLASILGRSKSATSQHLRVLRDGGIVAARRRGRAVIYSLTNGPMVEATVQVLNRAASIAAA
jgi:DNA-binding transcriptional ArsR family regulator